MKTQDILVGAAIIFVAIVLFARIDSPKNQQKLAAEQAIALVNSKTLSDCMYELVNIPNALGTTSLHVIRCPNSSVTTMKDGKHPQTAIATDNAQGSGK